MSLNLTGAFSSDIPGTYYLRQLGTEVYWYGEDSAQPPSWSNVAYGKIDANNNLMMEWCDVPKGVTRNEGQLTLKVSNDGKTITVMAETGRFGTRKITKI